MTLYDKNRRPIKVGDVVKVFHFIGKNIICINTSMTK